MTLSLWCLPLLAPLIAIGLLAWGVLGLAGLARAAWETARETW
jgi:hypothetical protein